MFFSISCLPVCIFVQLDLSPEQRTKPGLGLSGVFGERGERGKRTREKREGKERGERLTG